MHQELRNSFDAAHMASTLVRVGRFRLAQTLLDVANVQAQEYSGMLHSERLPRPVDPMFLNALGTELDRVGYRNVNRLVTAFDGLPVLQTTTHLGLSEGPVFLNAHQLASAGLPLGHPYFVGAYSGIPLSNNSRPGAINFGSSLAIDDVLDDKHPQFREYASRATQCSRHGDDRSISLIPSRMQNAPVWSAELGHDASRIGLLALPIRKFVKPNSPAEKFSDWACKANAAALSHTLRREVIYFDVNAVVREVLLSAAESMRTELNALLCDSALHRNLFGRWQCPMFYTNANRDPNGRFIPLWWNSDTLAGQGIAIASHPDSLVEGIRLRSLWPGTFLVYATLLMTGVKTLGGADHTEYLHHYSEALRDHGLLDPSTVTAATRYTLCCGRAYTEDHKEMCSVDGLIGRQLSDLKGRTVIDVFKSQLTRLVSRPFLFLTRT